MIAQIGDRIFLEGTHLGDPQRAGVIVALAHPDGSSLYEVRWPDEGRTTLIFPGADARIEHPARPGSPVQAQMTS